MHVTHMCLFFNRDPSTTGRYGSFGGAIHSNGLAVVNTITGCRFSSNGGAATRSGGAIAFTHSPDNVCHPLIKGGTVFHNNNASLSGGALSGVNVNSLTMDGCTFM